MTYTDPYSRPTYLDFPPPTQAPDEVTRTANAVPGPATVGQQIRRPSLLVPGIIGFSILGLTGLLVVGYLFLALGAGVVAFAGVMALIPLALVLLGVRWIDRWEPEPRGTLVFAFLWGAIASVFGALVVGLIVQVVQEGAGVSTEIQDFTGAVIQAPLVEEFAKGLGILILLFAARKHFDGPVDGVVYAATIAAGFAFTENILYFGDAVLGGVPAEIVGIFVMRGLMSPFAHVMFTICTGLALGIAARRRGAGPGILAFLIGLVPAIGLHALWNGATFVVGDGFLAYYALVQVPLFAGAIVLVVLLRRQESRLTATRLTEYATAGWFNPDEITALATPGGRRRAMSWARGHGIGAVMKGYIRDATKLAFVRQRLIAGIGATAAVQVDESALLAGIVQRRAALQPQAVVRPLQQPQADWRPPTA